MKENKNKQHAFRYFVLGLSAKEIAKLLDISHRTVENYMLSDDWQKAERNDNLEERILKMYESGKTYVEIAKSVGKCKTTVYNYLKRCRALKVANLASLESVEDSQIINQP